MYIKTNPIEILWPLVLSRRATETAEQRLATAKWLTGLILWVSRDEGELIGATLMQQYEKEYVHLLLTGYALQFSPVVRGALVVAEATPNTAEAYWAAVPAHLRPTNVEKN